MNSIRPSEVDTSGHFWESVGEYNQEVILRNWIVCSKVVAFARDDDDWHPISREDYEAFRNANNPDEPVGWAERQALSELTHKGYLQENDGLLEVTDKLLGVVVQFSYDQTGNTPSPL